ncbi:MAG: hypothetical protein PVF58_06815 [Candidatus Methanofastidiosia archaeon]|jgi:DNA modification methylase
MDTHRQKLETKYKDKIIKKLELKPYISYKFNKDIPFLGLYHFEEAFSFKLVEILLDHVQAASADYVLDPFCGAGTTVFTCGVTGIPSGGVDSLPLAWFISRTIPQFLLVSPHEITNIWQTLSSEIDQCNPANILEMPIMKDGFQEKTLLKLRKMKTAIKTLPHPYKDILLLLLLSILEECSKTKKINRYPHIVNKKGANPISAMNKKVFATEKEVAKNVYTLKESPQVFLGDAANLDMSFSHKPTHIITSPPYPDTIDYVKSYALELCFHFVKSKKEFKNLQDTLLQSHTHAVPYNIESHPAVKEAADTLQANPDISRMITAYFQDMNKVITHWYTILKDSASVVMVVDNLVYHNEYIPTDVILSDIAQNTGFTIENIWVANYRNTPIPVRESIVLWKK